MKTITSRARGFLAAAAVAIAGLGPAAGADSIKVGVITDRVGNSAAWAKPIEQGLELALAEINGAGGVLGKKIELLYESDQSKPDISATKARKLIDESGYDISLQIDGGVGPANIAEVAISSESQTEL